MIDNLNTRDERKARIDERQARISEGTKSARRQTVLTGRTGQVHADFIEATGLVPTIKASPSEPVIASIANGFNQFGPHDKLIEVTADTAYPTLTANATTFLGLDEDKAPVTSLLPPVYGQVFHSDRANKINASFNGTHGETEFVDEYGNHFRAYGSGWQISNVNQYSGMNTLRCGGAGTGNRCEVTPTNLDTRSLDQWTLEMFYRFDSFATDQTIFQLSPKDISAAGEITCIFNTSGQPRLYLSTNESTSNIWSATFPVNMASIASRSGFGDLAVSAAGHTAASWYHFAWVYDGLTHRIFINGYLVLAYSAQASYSEGFNLLKIGKASKIILGAQYSSAPQNQMLGNISNFAFHPYAKYQTKKFPASGDTTAVRDIFTPPTVPLSLTTQTDRYYDESEAIYLDFESASADDVFTKDKYGKDLVCFGNVDATLARGAYIESGAGAKFGTKNLRFDGFNSYENAAYIKAPVWADKWTVEFWAMDNSAVPTNKVNVHLVVPGSLGTGAFMVRSAWLGGSIRYGFHIGSAGSSTDIINFDTSYSYALSAYNHIAVSYDGVTYRCFVNGSLVLSTVSQLKVVNGSHICFGRAADNSEHLDGKIDDFAYVPYCKYTAGFTPPATALLATMPEQYVFDTKKMQMYKGYPTSFIPENTVFIGEATTSISKVEEVITYALNGEYEERFSSDFINVVSFTYFRKHNIGTGLSKGVLYGIALNGNYVTKGEVFTWTTFSSYPLTQIPLGVVNGKLFAVHLGSNAGTPSLMAHFSNGNGAAMDSNNGAHHFDTIAKISRSF